ncbi:tubulin polyglutamylase TTLL6-like protein [Gorgonomyces haynaldii]|nr:tubulin polyglutamylase TTLL6-like protein [Gorgonomyces haynaldii]
METRDEDTRVKKQKKTMLCNLTSCKYDIVQQSVQSSGFKLTLDPTNWLLLWLDTGVSVERLLEMKAYQRINHFPGMHEICRKDNLARNVSRLSRLFPKSFGFFPKTWILPHDWNEFLLHTKAKKGCYIAKPDHGCQGKGIFLFKDPNDVDDIKQTDMIVQTYLTNPCLIDGLKFDLRIYVLVTSVDPLRVFVYEDGLARFATEAYHPPNESNLEDMCMHLTNYAINKHSEKFVHDEKTGSKRSMQSVFEQLHQKTGADIDTVWQRICDSIVKTLLVVQPHLSKVVKQWFPSDPEASFQGIGSQCFEILGFDVILDAKLKPWVLEVNHSPSFTCDSPLDTEIKSGVISGALKLLNLNPSTPKKYLRQEKEKSQTRLWKGSNDLRPKTSQLTPEKEDRPKSGKQEGKSVLQQQALIQYYERYNPLLLEKLTVHEDKSMGNYQRIFPPADERKLKQYLYLVSETTKLSSETLTTKARKAFREQQLEQEMMKKKQIEEWKLKRERIRPNVQAKVDSKLSRTSIPAIPKKTFEMKIDAPELDRKWRPSIALNTQTLNDNIQGGWDIPSPRTVQPKANALHV